MIELVVAYIVRSGILVKIVECQLGINTLFLISPCLLTSRGDWLAAFCKHESIIEVENGKKFLY